MGRKPCNAPSDVDAVDGEVTIDGPDGVAISMTPEAAAETSDRLLHASVKAAGQRLNEVELQKRIRSF